MSDITLRIESKDVWDASIDWENNRSFSVSDWNKDNEIVLFFECGPERFQFLRGDLLSAYYYRSGDIKVGLYVKDIGYLYGHPLGLGPEELYNCNTSPILMNIHMKECKSLLYRSDDRWVYVTLTDSLSSWK